LSELLKRSIAALSGIVNVSTGLSHPLDESRAKELFKALRAEKEPLPYDTVKELALSNQWPERHASRLAELAQNIGEGKRVVIKSPRGWGEPTVSRLIEEVAHVKT